jgi:hypothetical protein
MIGATEREKITEIIAWAKAHPVSFDTVRKAAVPAKDRVMLSDRRPDHERPRSRHLDIPVNFTAAYSVEEQPAGFCAHLSVSVCRRRPGAMPNPQAVKMIAEEFGIPPFDGDDPVRMWVEEYAPGEFAVNLVHLYQPREEHGV